MDKYKIVDIFAAILAIIGFSYELYNDIYDTDDNDFGHLTVIAALFISIINQIAKKRRM